MLKAFWTNSAKVQTMPPSPDLQPLASGQLGIRAGNRDGDQTGFSNAVRNPDVATPAGLVGPDGLPSEKRFSVYRNNVMSSLIDAMGANFPAIKRLVGDEFFASLAREFIIESPPEQPMLFLYGNRFPEFLEQFPPVEEFPYLADVARVEFAWLQSYHAADIAVLDAAKLGSVPPEKVGQSMFKLHPAAWIFRSIWPAATLMDRNREGLDCSDIDLGNGEDILITRPVLDVQTRILPLGGYEFLNALAVGATLEAAARSSMESVDEFDFSSQITGMLECGVFCEIK